MNSRPQKTEHIVSREVDGEAVIVEPQNGMVNVVNQTATSIWRLIDGEHTPAEIAAAIADEYGIPLADALKDTEEFLQELETNQIITRV